MGDREEIDKEFVRLSRQVAHSLGDLDAAITCVGAEAERKFKKHAKDIEALQSRVDKLEHKDGV